MGSFIFAISASAVYKVTLCLFQTALVYACWLSGFINNSDSWNYPNLFI